MSKIDLVVGGLVPFTTIDFPGRLAAVVFCQGCPWNCFYCHNQHLLSPGPGQIPWPNVLSFLEQRQGLLEGVVFSGGEPLLQRGLTVALTDVRNMGYATALHTAGIYPDRLAEVLPLLDWVGFDIKAPFDEYAPVVGCNGGGSARAALEVLKISGVPHQLRCTLPPSKDAEWLQRLEVELSTMGYGTPSYQECRNAVP